MKKLSRLTRIIKVRGSPLMFKQGRFYPLMSSLNPSLNSLKHSSLISDVLGVIIGFKNSGLNDSTHQDLIIVKGLR